MLYLCPKSKGVFWIIFFFFVDCDDAATVTTAKASGSLAFEIESTAELGTKDILGYVSRKPNRLQQN